MEYVVLFPKKEVILSHRYYEPIPRKRESSFGTSYFLSYSRKLGRKISAFSIIEFDNMTCCEMNHHVSWYCERPMTTDICFNGKRYLIKPDLYVEFDNGASEFQWIQYKEKEIADKDAILIWERQSGEHVRFITEDDIVKGPYYIRNLNYLCAKARRYEENIDKYADKNFIYNLLPEKMTIGKLISRGLLDEKNGMSYIANLYFRGLISLRDIENKTISLQTEVLLNEE